MDAPVGKLTQPVQDVADEDLVDWDWRGQIHGFLDPFIAIRVLRFLADTTSQARTASALVFSYGPCAMHALQ
jgi:hypothetical protein